MAELIDRNALIDALMMYTWRDEDEHLIDDWDEKRRFIEDWLPSLPTIDAVEVVRCKDCKYGHAGKCNNEPCWECGLTGQITTAQGYCDEGVKRDADD